MKFKEAVTYDDMLLVPQYSDIKSRSEVNIGSTLKGVEYQLPIMSSPMDTVSESEMLVAMDKAGGLGVLHRYNTIDEQLRLANEAFARGVSDFAVAVGVTGDYLERAQALVDTGVETLCLDVAHGHHILMKDALTTLRKKFGNKITIIAGNVCTLEGVNDLADWGADAVRANIGGGSICSTRIVTGHGLPGLQTIFDCARTDRDVKIIADGGIKTSGDIVKALAAGADFVMLGSLLAGTDESPGQVFSSGDGKKYKVYRGMASVEAQVEWRGEARSLEGVSTTIPYKGSVKKILADLEQNIRSGLSYSGARDLAELFQNAKFIQQTNAGMRESNTHILLR